MTSLIQLIFGGGVQCILLGLIIEMLMRTYYESQEKGPYAIREILKSIDLSDTAEVSR